MGQKQLAYPITPLQGQELVRKTQASFAGGMNSDSPPSEIKANEVCDLENMIAYPDGHSEGRTGCSFPGSGVTLPLKETYLEAVDPSLSGFIASKTGNVVTMVNASGSQDVQWATNGRYIEWDDGSRDQIVNRTYTPGVSVVFTSKFSGDQSSGSVQLQDRVWATHLNEEQGKIVVQLGTDIYITDNAFSSYTKLTPLAGHALGDSKSNMQSDGSDVIIFNAAGQFRVVFVGLAGYYMKINEGQPISRTNDEPVSNKREFRYDYIYTLLRITGPGAAFGDRRTSGCRVVQESAPVLPDNNRRDTSRTYGDYPRGNGSIRYQRVVSASDVETDVSVWNVYTDGSFAANLNNTGVKEFHNDFSSAQTLNDIAAIIQRNMRVVYEKAECYWEYGETGSPKLVISCGPVNGGQMSYITAASGGTSSMFLKMRMGVGVGSIETISTNLPYLVTDMTTDNQKWTHFGIHRTKNVGEDGIAAGNLEDSLIWVRDIPIVKALRLDRGMSTDLISDYFSERTLCRADESSYFAWGDDRTVERISHLNISTNLVPTSDISYSEFESAALVASDETYVSDKDGVPVAMGGKKCSLAYQEEDSYDVFLYSDVYSNAWNQLVEADVGKTLFLSNGDIRTIAQVYDSYSCRVLELGEFGVGEGTPPASGYLAVAWDPILRQLDDSDFTASMTDDTKMVIVDNTDTADLFGATRTGGAFFRTEDLGKQGYLIRDGVFTGDKTGIVVLDANHAYFDEAELPAWMFLGTALAPLKNIGILLNVSDYSDYMPGRFFNDYVEDDEVSAFDDDPSFVLQTRFFRPLPSSRIGANAPAFMMVCEEGTGKLRYSSMPEERRHHAGFYHPTYQADTGIEDVITHMKCYNGIMVLFGKKSTWATNTSNMSSISEPAIGEKIFTVPTAQLIDQKGYIHVGSMEEIGVGYSILMCHDGSIVVFDGRQFNKTDFAQNKISKAIKAWHTNVVATYGPIDGYRIYGSPNVSSDTENFVNDQTGQCYRLAILPMQGSGWSRFSGESMVWPAPNSRSALITLASGMQIQVILDERSGIWYQIGTYSGPAGSGLGESFVDKSNANIFCSFTKIKHKGQRASVMLQHMESHVNIEPMTPGGSYLSGLVSSTQIFRDGEQTLTSDCANIPIDGDIAYDRRIEAKTLQHKYSFSRSKIRVLDTETVYVTRDTSGATPLAKRQTSELACQHELSLASVWITRGPVPVLNRSNGIEFSGDSFTGETGPDSISESAMRFDETGEGISGTVPDSMTGQWTLNFNYKR